MPRRSPLASRAASTAATERSTEASNEPNGVGSSTWSGTTDGRSGLAQAANARIPARAGRQIPQASQTRITRGPGHDPATDEVKVQVRPIGRHRRRRWSRRDSRPRAAPPCVPAPRPPRRAGRAARHRSAQLGRRGDVALGDDQLVHRRDRVDVVEGQDELILVHAVGRDLARDDPAEQAVSRVTASSSWLRTWACSS